MKSRRAALIAAGRVALFGALVEPRRPALVPQEEHAEELTDGPVTERDINARANDFEYASINTVQGMFYPNIAALRSVSPAVKLILQRTEAEHRRPIADRIRRGLSIGG